MCCCLHIDPYFYPTTSVHTESVLILHLRDIQIMCETDQYQTNTITLHQGKESEVLAYPARDHNKTYRAIKNKLREKVFITKKEK